jgi:lysophospholipase L1-like esterase
MRSRVVIYNPGVTGYYERLFGAPHPIFMNEREFDVWSKAAQDVIYDRTIRMRRFRPNLTELHNSSQPQGLTTNSFGFLGPERSLHKPPNTRRVAVLGDSVAQGWGVDQRRSFVSLLEDRLNAERPAGLSHRFEVLNFAVTGYELPQILDVAEEDVPRFEPDVCILALTELAVFRTWDEHLAWAIRLGIDPKYDSLRETISRSGASRDDGPLVLFGKLAPFRIPVVQAILAEMKLRALRSQVPFLVVLVPSLEDGGMSRKRFSGIPELLASLNIPVVDLQDTFDGILDLEPLRINPFDVHPSARAHAMILENLYAKLRAQPDVWTALVGTALPAF